MDWLLARGESLGMSVGAPDSVAVKPVVAVWATIVSLVASWHVTFRVSKPAVTSVAFVSPAASLRPSRLLTFS